jgi:hypothetical protein
MKNVIIEISPAELMELLQAYQTLQTVLEKTISPNELYLSEFLDELQIAQQEMKTGQFDEVKTFDDFIR